MVTRWDVILVVAWAVLTVAAVAWISWPAPKPDLDLRPHVKRLQDIDGQYSLGTRATAWGGKKVANVYLDAPSGNIVVLTESGGRVEISAEEIERRARETKDAK